MQIINRIKICSGVGMHAWYDTDLGFPVRKPIGSVEELVRPEDGSAPYYRIIHRSWWRRFVDFLKRFPWYNRRG